MIRDDPAIAPEEAVFGVAQVALDGMIIACDDGYAALMGQSCADTIGRNITEFTSPSEGYSPFATMQLLLRMGQPISARRSFLRADGSSLRGHVQLCLIRDVADAPHSVLAVLQVDPT